MKIACVGYREWALNIYDNLAKKTDHQFLIFRSRAQYDEKVLAEFNPQLVLFYGWSWIVPKEMVKNFKCVMLHPSPLPKYRGGSITSLIILKGIRALQSSLLGQVNAGFFISVIVSPTQASDTNLIAAVIKPTSPTDKFSTILGLGSRTPTCSI